MRDLDLWPLRRQFSDSYIAVDEIEVDGHQIIRSNQSLSEEHCQVSRIWFCFFLKNQKQLHATVMNARHMKRKKDNRKKMETFDAREIHKQFANEDWGEYLIQEAHLSQLFVFNQNSYHCCYALVPFPGEHKA